MRLAGLLVPAAAAALLAGCGDASSESTAPPPKAGPDVVQTVRPEYRVRTVVIETTGKAQFNEEQLARVQAPATGRVVEVLARPGDVVEAGQRLLVLDSPDLGGAKADYAKAVADADRGEKASALAHDLFAAKAIAEKDLRDADNDFKKAVAERERAAARLLTLGVGRGQLPAIASRADASTRIVVGAPRSGVVVERNVSLGQVVAYGQSDTPVSLFVVADLSTMWILADVYEPDVPKVRLGQPVSITLPCCPSDPWEGRVTYISDVVDKDTRTVKVRAVVPNRGRVLKAEMFVKVRIATGASRVLTVPQSAVHRADGRVFVLVRTGKDDYERRPVRLGAELDGSVEVLEGLTPEDPVVSRGSILLLRPGK